MKNICLVGFDSES